MMQGTAKKDASAKTYRLVAGTAYGFAFLAAALTYLPQQKGATSLIVLCALSSLCLGGIQLFRFRKSLFPLLSFLPAVPLSGAILLQSEPGGVSKALAALAIAFQARLAFLAFVEKRSRGRKLLAKKLQARLPKRTRVFVDHDIESEVPLSSIHAGHILRIAPGDIIPADGLVTFGSSVVDESLIPDEAENPKIKGMGSLVYAGCQNKNGALLVRVTATGTDTFLHKISESIDLHSGFWKARILSMEIFMNVAMGAALFFLQGPAHSLKVFLVSSGAVLAAAGANRRTAIAKASVARRWLWTENSMEKLAEGETLAAPLRGVFTENRPRLVAVESKGGISEDAVLSLLGPLARKLESPSAFSLLLELRSRNIPLEVSENFEAEEHGGKARVSEDLIRWISYSKPLPLPGELENFVKEHIDAGDEVYFMERNGEIVSALAFRDSPLLDTPKNVESLRLIGYPIVLLAEGSRNSVSRLQTDLGVEHAQGESGPAETQAVLDRLSKEKLTPIWVQNSAFLPKNTHASISTPGTGRSANLQLASIYLPEIVPALEFAKGASRNSRLILSWILSSQLGFLALSLIAALGNKGEGNLTSLAIVSLIPYLASIPLSFPRPSSLVITDSRPEPRPA